MFHKRHIKNLAKAWGYVYRERELIQINAHWREHTMRRIRHIKPLSQWTVYCLEFQQMVWRFTPAVATLILICAVCLSDLDLEQGYVMAKLFVDDPVEYTIWHSFGI